MKPCTPENMQQMHFTDKLYDNIIQSIYYEV